MNHNHWWIVAVVMVILEVISPAFFFLWLGIAAGVVGGLLFFWPELGWKAQWLCFSALSVLTLGVWHLMLKKRPTATDRPTLNRRSSQYIGRTFALSEPITNGTGRIRVDDSSWKVAGVDAPLGSRVRVVGADGTLLHVEQVSDSPIGTDRS
ncbi:MAG: NfeD family protein [Magnetococcales bacterium]|nr:NfeD family protein [Magnetococcales bacterium]